MSTLRAAIRLRSSDPSAVTGLLALKRSMPESCPSAMNRYDLWTFEGGNDLEEAVRRLAASYTDILNPNKQELCMLPEEGLLPGEDGSLVWISVEVVDDLSSASETWTSVVARAGYPITSVACSVLWRLGYDPRAGVDGALSRARGVGISVTRQSGLLSNPVSQSARIRLASAPGEAAPRR
jgi:hypothetical protein